MLTNAGLAERIDPHMRAILGMQDHNQSIVEEGERKGRINSLKRQRKVEFLPLEAQQKIVDEDGREWNDIAPDWMLEQHRSAVFGEDVPQLKAMRYMEDPHWPFGPGRVGSRGRYRPDLTEAQWEAIFDGWYCVFCLNRHDTPHPSECSSCGLSHVRYCRAMAYLERRSMLRSKFEASARRARPNRAQRRARGERSRGGLVLLNGGAA